MQVLGRLTSNAAGHADVVPDTDGHSGRAAPGLGFMAGLDGHVPLGVSGRLLGCLRAVAWPGFGFLHKHHICRRVECVLERSSPGIGIDCVQGPPPVLTMRSVSCRDRRIVMPDRAVYAWGQGVLGGQGGQVRLASAAVPSLDGPG